MTSITRRINYRQRERLVDLVESNKNVLYRSTGNVVKNQKWRHIACILNKLGAEKSVDQWKKTWADLKSGVKKKAIELKAKSTTTGADFPIEMQLSEEDYQVLRICDKKILEDLSAIGDAASFLGKINSIQRARLLELVEDKTLILCSTNTEEKMEVWSSISATLNGLGHKKSSDQWRGIWFDIKNGVKKKVDALEVAGTSTQLDDVLTKEDLQVIRIFEIESFQSPKETEDISETTMNDDISIDLPSSVKYLPDTSSHKSKMKNLKWTNHSNSIVDFQRSMINDPKIGDITLAFKGKSVKAHRLILSACSGLLSALLRDVPIEQDATIIVPDLDGSLLESLLTFIYMGETNMCATKLTEFLEAISNLGIKSPISFECGNVTAPIPSDMESIIVEDDVKQEFVDESYESGDQAHLSQKNKYFTYKNTTVLTEFHMERCSSSIAQDNADVLDEHLDIDSPMTEVVDEDPIGENNQTAKTPAIKIESSDDDMSDEASQPQTFLDKVDHLRTEQMKSLKHAIHAHLQGLTLEKAAIKYNVSRTALVRHVAMHNKDKDLANPQAKTKKKKTRFWTSDEDDEETTKTDLLRIRKHIRTRSNPLDLPDNKFKRFFKMSKESFVYILDEVRDKLPETTRSSSVPAILKLATTLRFLVEGSYQKGLSNEYKLGLAQPTLSKVLTEMLNILESHICPQWIKFKYTEEEIQKAKLYFYQQAGIPGVIGCVDATFIKIMAPTQDQQKYCNWKGAYTLHTMIGCDHRMTIRFVDARHPGSVHESTMWNSSNIRGVLQKSYKSGEKNSWLLGDAGFPLEPFLITPYTSVEEGSKESNFNKKISKTKEVIAKTIALLKSRFQCLLGERPLHYTPQKSTQIVNVCTAIHNICLHFKSELPIEPNIDDDESEPEPDIVNYSDKKGEKIRNQILNAILTI